MLKDKNGKNVVVIGGGTGASVALRGLKKYQVNLSVIITTADDGSSSGILSRKYKMVPPGDARQCLVSLASGDFEHLNERFQEGFFRGHTLGNLLIAFLHQKHGSFQKAIDELLGFVGAQGSILPMTLRPVALLADLADGHTLRGENKITSSREINKKIKALKLSPQGAHANPKAVSAIKNADVLVVGPGNLYSSILPNFLVKEIREAAKKSKAKKIYVSNLLTQPGHTDNFYVEDFVEVLAGYIGEDIFDYIVYHNRAFPESLLNKNKNASVGEPVLAKQKAAKEKRILGRSIASSSIKEKSSSDPIAHIRNPFVHDSKKLAKVIMRLIQAQGI